MEESKYYTPEIEEFHVGFEYELRVAGGGDRFVKEELHNFDFDLFLNNLYRDNEEEFNLRVKHLDREDIESLGFKLLKEDLNGKAFIHKINVELQIWWSSKGTIDIDNGMSYSDCRTYFYGTIKNKSELKRVLKMIGI